MVHENDLAEHIESLGERVRRLEENDQSSIVNLVGLWETTAKELNGKIDGITTQFNGRIDGIATELNGKIDGIATQLNGKIDGMRDDMSMIKGAHARNEALREPGKIAHSLKHTYIHEVGQDALQQFGDRAASELNASKSDAESFINADLVMMVNDRNYHPMYIAVEASYTVHPRDVERAVRNADYVQELTGVPACPVVAGVEMMPDAESLATDRQVDWYQIPPRDLEPN